MPNTLIDMGFYSARQFYIWDRSGGVWGTDTTDGWATDNAGELGTSGPFMTWMRDRIKTAMEAENGGLNWEVGRIFRWEGTSTRWHYAFPVRHLDNGTPDGPEWLFCFNGMNSGDTTVPDLSEQNEGWGVHSTTQIHGAISGGSDSYQAMHYNPYGTLSTYDIDAVAADTWNVANDFNAPNSNPFSAPDAFMPDRSLSPWVPGFSIYAEVLSNSLLYCDANRFCYVFNHEIPFIAFYCARAKAYSLRDFFVTGEIIVPRVASDPYTHGTYATNNFHDYGSDWGPFYYGLNPDGVTFESFSNASHTQFSRSNQPRADGTYDRDYVKIYNTNVDKGFMHLDVNPVMGPNGSDWMQLYDSQYGTLMKFRAASAIPWVDNAPVFPGGYPTNGWFGPRIQTSVGP